MSKMMQIGRGLNVAPLVLALERNPNLWNEYKWRTGYETSPHRDCDDIWVRYNDVKNLDPNNLAKFNEEHDAVWYPSVSLLPQVKEMAFMLMNAVKGERLGGVLITRIPPKKMCYPHEDHGWHAEYYDKYAVQLKGNLQQAFCFKDEQFSAVPGDVYWFNNQAEHWVINESNEERITIIFCIRSERK